MKYTELSSKQKDLLLSQMVEVTGFHHDIIEKDWWVTQVLKAIPIFAI